MKNMIHQVKRSAGRLLLLAGALVAGMATAADIEPVTCKWISGAVGDWSDSTKWVDGIVPRNGDILSFDGGATASNDLGLNRATQLVKTGSGTATLTGLPSDMVIDSFSLAGGTLILRWINDTPSSTPISASSALVGTLDLGGGALNDSTSIVSDGGAVTIKNGQYSMSADFPDSIWNCTIGEGATLNVSGRLYAGLVQKKYLTLENGSVVNFTGTGTSILGSWYSSRAIYVALSGGSVLNHANGDFWAGCSGVGEVVCDNATLNLGQRELCCTRPSDNTKKGKDNGFATFDFSNGSVFRVGTVRYGYEGHTDGTFDLTVDSGSTMYVGTIEAVGDTAANILFDNATVVPMADGVLFKDHPDCTAARIHVNAGGLTIANSNSKSVTLDARMDGEGVLTFQADGCAVTVNKPILCGSVVLENPGSVGLTCDNAFGADMVVTLRYTETPVAGQVVTWTTRPEQTVFKLTGDAARGYELEEVESGLLIKATGAQPAADAYWTGAGEDPSVMTDRANWELRDAQGAVMAQGYINEGTTCHFTGGTLPFDLDDAFSCQILRIEGNAVLEADRDWTATTVPFCMTAGATVDLNGHTMALSTPQNIAGASFSFVGASGAIVFDVNAGKTNEVAGLSLSAPAELVKRGAGTLRLVDLAGQPVLRQEEGMTLLAWTGEPPADPFAKTPVNVVKGTLALGGAAQSFSAGMGEIFQNGTVLLDGVYTTSNARWSWPSADDVYTIGAGAEVHSAGEWTQMNKYCPQFYVKDGGIFSYESTALCKLGWRYSNRKGKIYLQNGGVWQMDKADLGVGISGYGYLYVQGGSLFDAPLRNICLDAKYEGGSDADVGYGYMEVVGGSQVNVKKLLFGQDGYEHGEVEFVAKGNSLLCLEYMGPDGTAVLAGGLKVSFEGATIVPMADTTLESPLLSDGQDYDEARFHVNGAGLCVSNVNEKSLAFDAKFDGTGPFEVKAFQKDIALASTLAVQNVVLTDVRRMTLAEGAQLSVDGGSVRLNYTAGRPVRFGRVISWEPGSQPTGVTFELDDVTSQQYTLQVGPDGVYIGNGFLLILR